MKSFEELNKESLYKLITKENLELTRKILFFLQFGNFHDENGKEFRKSDNESICLLDSIKIVEKILDLIENGKFEKYNWKINKEE